MNDTTTDSTSRKARRKPNRALIATIAVIVAAGGWYGVSKYLKSGDDEGEYIYAAVTTGDIEDLVTSTGTLQPRDFVDVGAQVSGQIERLFVEVGDVVKKGQELAKIDATTSEARVEANKASLEASKTNLETQKENLRKAERDYQRQVNLLAEDATTKQAELDAKTALENARRQILSSEAQIRQQEANMRIEAKNLGYTTIIAPIDGTVMSIQVKEGQTVNATQNVPVVLRLANLSTMTVQAEVSEADVSKLYKGIPVYFTTLGGQNRRWYGELKRVEPTPKVQNSVVLYTALFDVDNDSGTLMPSMTAQVYFVSAKADGVLMVPMAALQQGQQIARELAEKEREKKGAASPTGAAGEPGAPGAAPNAATAAAGVERGGAAAAAGPAPAAAPGDAAATQGNRRNGEGMRAGGAGGASGGFGGFNGGQAPTPEQIEQFRRMRAAGGQGGGGFGGQRPGGFGGMGMTGGAGAGAARAPQQRRGTVMVKLADGQLEPRQVVIGVTNRVHGQVLEGLKEGEEVVVAKREAVAAPGSASQPQQQNQNQNRPNNFQGGGFPGGGGNFRPF